MSAAPVVFVHGLIGTFRVPDLTGYFPEGAIAPDLLGYGACRDIDPDAINLHNQASHLRDAVIRAFGNRAVHLVGHSVGGVVAALYAQRYSRQIRSFTSVEGNFTLKDAFWTASVARMSAPESVRLLDGLRRDPVGWLMGSGIAASPERVDIARCWLNCQPASTLRAMARSVVEITGEPAYLSDLRTVFAHHAVHLVAGERSRATWDVPHWALTESASLTIQSGAGHLMMLDDTDRFASILRRAFDGSVERTAIR